MNIGTIEVKILRKMRFFHNRAISVNLGVDEMLKAIVGLLRNSQGCMTYQNNQ